MIPDKVHGLSMKFPRAGHRPHMRSRFFPRSCTCAVTGEKFEGQRLWAHTAVWPFWEYSPWASPGRCVGPKVAMKRSPVSHPACVVQAANRPHS